MDDIENNHEPVEIDFGDECDLHHFSPGDRAVVVAEFLRQAGEKGLKRIRIVHGKGRSTAKEQILRLLEGDPRVERFGDDGPNWGATIIILK